MNFIIKRFYCSNVLNNNGVGGGSIVGNLIYNKLKLKFNPFHLQVLNESHMHSKGKDTYFKVIVVSDEFIGKSPVNQHRLINETLSDELSGNGGVGIHALSIHCSTVDNWNIDNNVNPSPTCLGGSKKEKKLQQQREEIKK